MSAEVKALTDAIVALSKSNLSMCDELGQSRLIQSEMARTLVQIHQGQERIVEQLAKIVERQNSHEKQAHSSEREIRAVKSLVDDHAARIQSLEEARSAAQ